MGESLGKALDKKPNTPEYVELVSSGITEDEDNITFTFTFARPMSEDEIDELYHSTTGMFHDIIFGKLHEKHWTEPAEEGFEDVLIPFSMESSRGADGKTWTIRYHRTDIDGDEDDNSE